MKRPKLPQDLPIKIALGGLLAFSFVQYIGKAVILSVIDEIKERKKRCRENN